eukprot:gene6178-6484_t
MLGATVRARLRALRKEEKALAAERVAADLGPAIEVVLMDQCPKRGALRAIEHLARQPAADGAPSWMGAGPGGRLVAVSARAPGQQLHPGPSPILRAAGGAQGPPPPPPLVEDPASEWIRLLDPPTLAAAAAGAAAGAGAAPAAAAERLAGLRLVAAVGADRGSAADWVRDVVMMSTGAGGPAPPGG